MALTISELNFVFGADGKAVDRAGRLDGKANTTASKMSRSMSGFWREETARARKSADDYGRAGKEAGSRFANGVKGQLAGLALGSAAVLFLKDSVNAASQAEQAVGGVQAVFGDYADTVVADSKRAQDALGLSVTQYQELITVTGALLKNKGLDDFAERAERVVQVGADLAAQYGGTTKDAVDALNAAMRGESDPIERYAISLNETAVNAQLAAQGQTTLKGAALERAKAQARLAIIDQQSADALGAFTREADTHAGKQQRLTAQIANLRVEMGEKLLPVATDVIQFFADDAVPALERTGSAVVDVYGAWSDLPDPIKATAAAIVALRIADMLGWTESASRGASRLGDAITDLRLRTMMAGDEFRTSRANVMGFSNGFMTVDRSLSRTQSTLAATKVAFAGVGSTAKSALGGVLGILGGPWGAALTLAAGGVAYFWSEHQEAKERVEAFTATLDEETGALTENSTEWAKNNLLKSGALEAAKKVGVSLEDVTQAALGDEDALRRLSLAHARFQDEMQAVASAGAKPTGALRDQGSAWSTLNDAVGELNGEVSAGRTDWQLLAEATGETAGENDKAAGSFKSLADRMREAKDEVNRLADAEQERREQNLQDREDRLALIQQMQATKDEAGNKDEVGALNERIDDARTSGADERRGLRQQITDIDPKSKTAARDRADLNRQIAESLREENEAVADAQKELGQYTKTLNEHTKAGQENLQALYDLAGQWNGSSEKVRNAKGAYDEVRQAFIDTAKEMGATQNKAERLATELLLLPEPRKLEYPSDDLDEAIDKLRELQKLVKDSQDLAIRVNVHNDGNRFLDDGRAVGGPAFKGRSYRVGETGVEIFRPKQDGYILPSSTARQLEQAPAAAAATAEVRLSAADRAYMESLDRKVTEALTRRMGPMVHADVLQHVDLRETERYARSKGSLEADGGVPIL